MKSSEIKPKDETKQESPLQEESGGTGGDQKSFQERLQLGTQVYLTPLFLKGALSCSTDCKAFCFIPNFIIRKVDFSKVKSSCC